MFYQRLIINCTNGIVDNLWLRLGGRGDSLHPSPVSPIDVSHRSPHASTLPCCAYRPCSVLCPCSAGLTLTCDMPLLRLPTLTSWPVHYPAASTDHTPCGPSTAPVDPALCSTLLCTLPCSVIYPALRSLPPLRLPLPVLRLCRAGVGLARQPRSLTAVVGCVGSPALMGPEGRRLDDVLDSWRTSWFYYVRRDQAEFRREWAGRLGREIVPEPDGTTVMPVTYGRRCISA